MTEIKKYLKYISENETTLFNSQILSQIDNEVIITHCAHKYSHNYFEKMEKFKDGDKNLIESLSYIQKKELGIFSKRPKTLSEKINNCSNLLKSILRPDLLAPQDFEKKQFNVCNIILLNFFLNFSKKPLQKNINFKLILDIINKTNIEFFEIFEINYYFRTQFFKLNNLTFSFPVSYLTNETTIFYGDQKNTSIINYETLNNFNNFNSNELSITNQTKNLLKESYKFDKLPKLFKLKFYDLNQNFSTDFDKLIKHFFTSPITENNLEYSSFENDTVSFKLISEIYMYYFNSSIKIQNLLEYLEYKIIQDSLIFLCDSQIFQDIFFLKIDNQEKLNNVETEKTERLNLKFIEENPNITNFLEKNCNFLNQYKNLVIEKKFKSSNQKLKYQKFLNTGVIKPHIIFNEDLEGIDIEIKEDFLFCFSHQKIIKNLKKLKKGKIYLSSSRVKVGDKLYKSKELNSIFYKTYENNYNTNHKKIIDYFVENEKFPLNFVEVLNCD